MSCGFSLLFCVSSLLLCFELSVQNLLVFLVFLFPTIHKLLHVKEKNLQTMKANGLLNVLNKNRLFTKPTAGAERRGNFWLCHGMQTQVMFC